MQVVDAGETWFIGGSSRSGSTLLSGLLSIATDGFNAGELHLLWRSLEVGRRCTCGVALSDCDVWRDVAQVVLKRLQLGSVLEAAATEAMEPSQRKILVHGARLSVGGKVLALRAETERALREVTGQRVLVDSSKVSSTALVAQRQEAAFQLIHLVRDPRAVAFSMSKPKPDPSLGGRPMPERSALKAALAWMSTNMSLERIGRLPDTRYALVRYERLARDPRGELARLVESNAFQGDAVLSSGEHGIAGNPWRFQPGREIEPDERWVRELGRRERRTVEAMTWPLLVRYGFHRDSSDALRPDN